MVHASKPPGTKVGELCNSDLADALWHTNNRPRIANILKRTAEVLFGLHTNIVIPEDHQDRLPQKAQEVGDASPANTAFSASLRSLQPPTSSICQGTIR